ncbi:hypothetical protein WJX74_010419 [Apatococcus lobatus]|uniref:Ribosome biogenesis protein BOP1 homolog n=1 Tax=Apatococcus lobatus TaxID=904363 RepID=A0AAW1RDB3_9CHLO
MKRRVPSGAAKAAIEPIPEDSDAALDTGSLKLSSSDSEVSSYPSDEVASDISFESSEEEVPDAPVPEAAAAAAAASDQDELDRAVLDYVVASQQVAESSASPEEARTAAAQPSPRADSDAEQEGDTSDEERPQRNTVGDVPLQWYRDEDHIGYDREGQKLIREVQKKDRLDALIQRNDDESAWRTLYDEYNDEELTLSKEELQMVQRIREGQFPHIEVNPYEPEAEWYSKDREIHPLSGAPEPKRRFVPSKWEEKRIVKLVRALRKGWIKRDRTPKMDEAPAYMLWQDDGMVADRPSSGLAYVPAPKPQLPGHDESFNPPKEFLLSEEEAAARRMQAEENGDPAPWMPASFDALRRVPLYSDFIKERFERCLDLYLAPRARRMRLHIPSPEALLPQLPKPRDLQPFPTTILLKFLGHTGKVRSVAPDHSGQWLASGGDDGLLRVWEVRSGRCMRSWDLQAPIHCVAWCPNPSLRLLSAASASRLVLVPSGTGTQEVERGAAEALEEACSQSALAASDESRPMCSWQRLLQHEGAAELVHLHPVRQIAWHGRGDYFASVAPTGNTQAVLVHQLSKGATQNPFQRNRGRVTNVLFHPVRPFLFVATQNSIRIYDLARQALANRLLGGSGVIASMAVHPSGDHVIVGSADKRLAWYDMDLSTKPYRALHYHSAALRSVAFHPTYPLFASASDDATVHIFHGMVYQDLLTNPLIVPVKILRGHRQHEHEGVLSCSFHPQQPWIFAAGADGEIALFGN